VAHLDYPQGEAMLQTDLLVLAQAGLDPSDKAGDLAAGDGRQFVPLWQEGHDIVGGDYDPQLLGEIKKRAQQSSDHKDLKLVRLDWEALPFTQGSFNFVFLLGRDLHHFVTALERRRFFSQIRKIVNKDATLVVDIADPTSEKYETMITATSELTSGWRREWEDAKPAIDTMDRVNYTLRIFPSFMQLVEDAKNGGFEICKAYFQPIPGTDGKNIYFVFKAV
jgi:ubiquinone/menaquinone biosynthesis C-methylase UbiE